MLHLNNLCSIFYPIKDQTKPVSDPGEYSDALDLFGRVGVIQVLIRRLNEFTCAVQTNYIEQLALV